MQQYIEIKVSPLSDAEQDILMAWLSDLNFYGFQKTENALLAYINKDEYSARDVSVWIPEDKKMEIRVIDEVNWNQKWESELTPVIFDHFLTIRAGFHQPVNTTEYEIVITPKMSFGTGHHATTSLMIRQMKELNFGNKSVIDFGTGTGILAILAEKMGATQIIAIDKDEWSIENAQENIQTNKCSRISIGKADELDSHLSPADIVLANITADVLLQHSDSLKSLTKKEGQLVLSGFLAQDEKSILTRFQNDLFEVANILQEENWRCISFQKGA